MQFYGVYPPVPDTDDREGRGLAKLIAILGNPAGATLIADTSEFTNSGKGFFKIKNGGSAVINTMTASDINAGVAVTAYTMAAGEELLGNFSTITLTSGKLWAFHKP